MNIQMNANGSASNKLIYPELSYKIIGVLFKAHTELGNRYQEKYYERAVGLALDHHGLKYKKQLPVILTFGGEPIGKYFLDFLIENKIVLELKAVLMLTPKDFKQISAYLKSSNIKLGILSNFRPEKLEYHRILNANVCK
jgi:GxxExxY protein